MLAFTYILSLRASLLQATEEQQPPPEEAEAPTTESLVDPAMLDLADDLGQFDPSSASSFTVAVREEDDDEEASLSFVVLQEEDNRPGELYF